MACVAAAGELPPNSASWAADRAIYLRFLSVTIFVVEQDEFWRLIAVLGGRTRDADFERLTAQLAERSPDDIVAFEDRLATFLYALDTRDHSNAAKARNDWFLYVRCAVLVAGRDVYEQVLAEPARAKRFARQEAELLLSVASQAYERRTGMLWEHETPVSYESGSNAVGWGDPEADQARLGVPDLPPDLPVGLEFPERPTGLLQAVLRILKGRLT